MSAAKRRVLGPREFVFFVALISAMSALAIDILLPAFSDMRPAFDLDPDAVLFSFVGRWTHEKGLDLLADTIPILLDRHPKMQIYLVGPIGDAVEAVLDDAKLGEWIDPAAVRARLERHRQGVGDHGEMLWAVLVFARFLRRWCA